MEAELRSTLVRMTFERPSKTLNADAARLAEHAQTELEVRRVLKTKVCENAAKEREFTEWERRMQEKQVTIEENIVNCDDMLREADAKRDRARKSAMDDLRAQRMKSRDITISREFLSTVRAKNAVIDHKLKANARYFQYLYRASQTCSAESSRMPRTTENVYELVEETLDRHRTLRAANEQLQARITSTVRAHDEMIQANTKYVGEARETILALNTRLGDMKRELEAHIKNTSAHVTSAEHLSKKSLSRRASVSLVKISTDNMHAKCVKRSKVSRCAANEARCASDTAARLNIIRLYMRDVREIIIDQTQ